MKIKLPKDKSFIFLAIFTVIFAGIAVKGYLKSDYIKEKISSNQKQIELSFSDVLRRQSDIQNIIFNTDDMNAKGTLKDGTKFTTKLLNNSEVLTELAKKGIEVKIESRKKLIDRIASWSWILISLIFMIWIFRGMKNVGGGNFKRTLIGQNPTKIVAGKTKTTFADVAGIDNEKEELQEIVNFLKDSKKFKAVGAKVPRGVLLSGEPGTGKTLLARAIAGEANVPFFATSGSDFSGIIVGLGVAKIKDIFEMAKRNAPCILFIDEIDAIGQKRGNHSYNDQDREQTLNQLLIEMDGFSNETGIIVIGATNRPDMLDAALLRPGRFDRQVYIDYPDLKGREAILNLHAKKVKLSKSVNLNTLARGTQGFSGAELANLLNEAALYAVKVGHKEIEQSDLDTARDKILMGPEKRKNMRAEDIKLTAYHEAGHAYVSVFYRNITDPIHKATIVPRGRALGMVQHLPIDDKVSMTKEELKANLSIYMAGRASEEIFFGDNKVTTGAESDIAGATKMARYAIVSAGLSRKIGTVAINQANSFGGKTSLENASEKMAEIVDSEVKSWMDEAHNDAIKILTKNKTIVKKLAEELLKKETLSGEEILKITLNKTGKSKKKNDKI